MSLSACKPRDVVKAVHQRPVLGWLVFAALTCLLVGGQGERFAAADESSDLQAFRRMQGELMQRMDDSVEGAVEFLESKISENPSSGDLQVLRESLALRLSEEGEDEKAVEQMKKLLVFQADHISESGNAFGVWLTTKTIEEMSGGNQGKATVRESVKRSTKALQTLDGQKAVAAMLPLSQLIAMEAQFLVEDDQPEVGKRLVEQQLIELSKHNMSEACTESSMRAHIRMLRTLVEDKPENDPWREGCIENLDTVVGAALERFPNSLNVQSEYAETQYQMITRWKQEDPEENKKRMDSVVGRLVSVARKNPNVKATLRRLQIHQERLEAVKPVETLVGKSAPEWSIDAWVDGKDRSQADFEGKVVLLDFWAMWCGPCIATFDHLRELRKEFGGDDFEIVGVTQYYNYVWDDLNQRASRSEDEVSPAEERETLAAFLKHHRLEHPVFVGTKNGSMSSDYGVRGIPHVVIIDQQGTVQLIQVGAGKQAADAIHAKVKELLESEKENDTDDKNEPAGEKDSTADEDDSKNVQ